MQDAWQLEHSKCFDISQDLLPVFLLLELLGLNGKCFLVVVNVLQNWVILHHLVVKVVNIELQGLQGVSHLLLLLFLLVFIAFDAHCLKFAISVCGETSNFRGLPSLFVCKNRLQSESLLIICEFAILT